MNRGILFVVSGASGVGKGSILSLVLASETPERVFFSVSWTTRERRPREIEAKDYHFVGQDQFLAELNDPTGGGFLEHAEFVGNLYGTPCRPVEAALSAGRDVVLDIELDGAMQVKRSMPDAVFILVVPPSLSILRMRLLRRGTDALPVIAKRLERAIEDMSRARHFDYVIENDELHTAVDDLLAVLRSERLRYTRQDAAELARHSSRDEALERELDRTEEKIRASGA